MSDYLKNIKNKEWQNNDKPRPGRQVYRDHIYKGGIGYDRRGERDRRSTHHRKHQQENTASVLGNFLPEVQSMLEQILENQKAQTEAYERMTAAEEGVNKSLKKISQALCAMANIAPETEEPEPPVPHEKSMAAPAEPSDKYYENDENDDDEMIFSPIDKDEVIKIIVEMRNNGATFDMIAMHLDNENIPTFSNRGKWHAQTIHRLYTQNRDAFSEE